MLTQIMLGNSCLQLRCSYEDRYTAKSISGCSWNPEERVWEYPLRSDKLQELAEVFGGARVDKQVRLALSKLAEAEEIAQITKYQSWENAVSLEPMHIKTKPFKHQIAGYNLGVTLPAAGLLFEQGCGKTLTAIAIMGTRFTRGEIKRVLIVAPASVVPVWPKEFAAHADFPHTCKALEGPVKKRIEQLQEAGSAQEAGGKKPLTVVVINYEATWRMEEALIAWKPDMIIADESQRIKTPGARQSKSLHKLGRTAKYRLILTGTPVTQGPLDFYSQYKFLEPNVFGSSYYAFKARYAIFGGYENREIIGYNNLPELIQRAHSLAFRVRKEDALDLPEFMDQELYCELEARAKRIYSQLARESAAELEDNKLLTAANILAKLLRLSQLTGGYLGDGEGEIHQVSKAKLSLLEETLSDLMEAGKKVVIFARFIPEMKAIRRALDKKKIEYGFIAGEVKQQLRGEEVRRFQEDPECRVFLAQIQTAGLGITLTAADTAVFYSLDYSYANYDQCRARIHRIGQQNKCTYVHLIAKDTVDEKALRTLKAKKSVADEVVDGWRGYLS